MPARHRVAAHSVLDWLVSVGLPGREVGRAALERPPLFKKESRRERFPSFSG